MVRPACPPMRKMTISISDWTFTISNYKRERVEKTYFPWKDGRNNRIRENDSGNLRARTSVSLPQFTLRRPSQSRPRFDANSPRKISARETADDTWKWGHLFYGRGSLSGNPVLRGLRDSRSVPDTSVTC